MSEPGMTTTTVQLDTDLRERIDAIAKVAAKDLGLRVGGGRGGGVSVSWVVRQALDRAQLPGDEGASDA